MNLTKTDGKDKGKQCAQKRTRTEAFCLLCKTRVSLMTIEQTKKLYASNWNDVLRLADDGEVHLIHNSKGELQVCINSLQQATLHFQDTKLLNPRLVNH